MGLEAVALARDAIGLSIALEQAHAKLHKNGVHATGVYSVEGSLTDPQWQQLSAWIKKQAGGDAKGNPLILDHGAKWLQQAMTGVDAQHVETRMHQIGEIARAMRVMPIMIGLADKTATYASSEQMFLAHVVHTLSPWYERIEQSADVNLLTPEERDAGFYTKFQPNGLMRGAAKDRAEFFAKALGSGGGKGWMTQNEVRAADDMERSDDPEADKLPQAVAKPAPPPGSGGEQEDDPDASA
jgi:HK97 family phage portal protein